MCVCVCVCDFLFFIFCCYEKILNFFDKCNKIYLGLIAFRVTQRLTIQFSSSTHIYELIF